MWLFCKYGFFSVTKAPGKPGWVQVRARRREDLERLGQRYTVAHRRILETPERDYPYRIILGQQTWSDLVARIAEDIDYENFKDRVHELDPDPERANAYLSVWAIMARFGSKVGVGHSAGGARRQLRAKDKWQTKTPL